MGIGVDSVFIAKQYEQCLLAYRRQPQQRSNRIIGVQPHCSESAKAAKDNGESITSMTGLTRPSSTSIRPTLKAKTTPSADYKVGMFIDLFDQGDTGFAVFEITAEPTLDGDIYTIGVTPRPTRRRSIRTGTHQSI